MIDGVENILPIVTFDENTGWEDVLKLAQPHLDKAGLERLRRAVESAKTVLVERHYIDKDYRETFSSYHSKKFHTPTARCVRLHFFNERIDRSMLGRSDQTLQYNYLGYSVLRPTRPNCVGRTLIRPDSRADISAHLTMCEETVYIQGLELSISGFPFISQDGDATVCAQATLWMLMRYFSNRYPAYQEIYPVQIGNLTRDYSVGRLLPTAGLYVWQMAEALRQVNFASVIYNREEDDTFEHLLYTYIESGIPVLAVFEDHVVVLFGHQSDYSLAASVTPSPGSPFVFSSEFNRAFVGNDDNGIPYQVLRATPQCAKWEEMCRDGDDDYYSTSDIKQFVAPLPERVFLTAENVEALATTLLKQGKLSYTERSPRVKSQTPLLRIFLTTGRGFKKRLRERKGMGHTQVETVYRGLPLPHFIWVCEISHPSLYPHEVLGEVIWDATRNPYEPNGFLAVHYPEVLIVDLGSALNRAPDLVEFPLEKAGSYPIYRHNLRRETEWKRR